MEPIARSPGGPDGRRHVSRLMLVRADGCRVCFGLDSVDGLFELADAAEGEATLPIGGERVPLVSWNEVVGLPPLPGDGATLLLVVRTPSGRVGLAVDACIGVRDAAFSSALLPTRLAGGTGECCCFVHLLDRQPHFIVDPRALEDAVARRSAARPTPEGGEAPPAP